MADERIVTPVKVVDPTTTGQQQAVNASGQASVLEANSAAIKTAVELSDDVVKADDAGFTVATDKVAMAGFLCDETSPDTIDEADAGAARIDASRRQLVRLVGATDGNRLDIDGSGHAQVDIAAQSANLTVVGAAADGAAVSGNPVLIAGQDGTNAQSINTDSTGRLIVVGPAADGAAVAGNPVRVGAKDGSGNTQDLACDTAGVLSVNVLTGGGVDSPTNPARELVTSAALAAGSSANLDSADLPSKYLWQATFTASVPMKIVLSLNNNGSLTNLDTVFTRAGETYSWKPPHRAFAQAPSAGAGVQGWRAAATNMDTSEAADVYATFMYADN